MARVGTSLLNLGTWVQSEAPGAGSQSVDNTGLNGNWIKLDTAVGTEHTTAGVHAANIIDGPNLKTTAADGVTVVLAGSPLKLSVPAGGIGPSQLATGAVTAGKIATGGVSTSSQLEEAIVTANKIALGAVQAAHFADDAVTAPKISHDNNRTKILLVFSWDGLQESTTYAKVNGEVLTAARGVPMTRAGSITGLAYCLTDGSVATGAYAYGTWVFAVGDRLAMTDKVEETDRDLMRVLKNGAQLFTVSSTTDSQTVVHCTLELELDD